MCLDRHRGRHRNNIGAKSWFGAMASAYIGVWGLGALPKLLEVHGTSDPLSPHVNRVNDKEEWRSIYQATLNVPDGLSSLGIV